MKKYINYKVDNYAFFIIKLIVASEALKQMLKYDKNNSKQKIQATVVVFALIILGILITVNLSSIGSFFSVILSIVSPIIIGFAIAYMLNPILKFFEFVVFKRVRAKRFVRVISLILTYIVALLTLGIIIYIIFPRLALSILDIGKNFNTYLQQATDFVNSIVSRFSSVTDKYDPAELTQLIGDIFTESGDIFQAVSTYVISYAMELINAFKNIFLGLFISIYVLISKERLSAQFSKGARAFMSDKIYRNMLRYLRRTNSTFGRFFIGKIFDSAIVAFITVVLLLIFRMPYCLLIAMIVGILNIIPFFGIIIATIVSSFIVFIATPDKFLLFLLIMLIIYQIDVNVIAPRILGKSAGISSLGVIIAVIIMGEYFGVVGMIIAVPVFAVIISVIKEWIERKLRAKELPTKTTDYYADPEHTHQSKDHRTATKAILDSLSKVISGLRHTHDDDHEGDEHIDDNHKQDQDSGDQNGINSDRLD